MMVFDKMPKLPEELANMSDDELGALCDKIRGRLIEAVSEIAVFGVIEISAVDGIVFYFFNFFSFKISDGFFCITDRFLKFLNVFRIFQFKCLEFIGNSLCDSSRICKIVGNSINNF